MTKHELSQLYWLTKEAARLQMELVELQQPVTQTITGMPRGSGVSDKVHEYVRRKMLIEEKIKTNLLEIQYERGRLEDYIASVPESEMRLILRLRHVNGMGWEQIGAEIGYTKSGVFRKYQRFFESVNQFNNDVC